MICAWGCVAGARRGSSRRADMLDIAFGCRRISADIQSRILSIRICDNTLAFAKGGECGRENTMREFWVSVGAMVLGYIMYLGVRAIFKRDQKGG